MKAVIPAAGIGTRLRPHTLNKPKALLPVAGKPILAHIVDDLDQAGIDSFVLIVGYHGDAVRTWFAEQRPELDITYVEQEQRLGLGHAIWTARHTIGDESFFCILGDTILKADYQLLLGSANNVIAVREVADPRRFGVVEMERDTVVRFVEKPEIPPSNLAIVGAYLFRDGAALWQALDQVVDQDIRTKGEYQLTDALQIMVTKGIVFNTLAINDWYDCGKSDAWIETNRVLLQRQPGQSVRAGIIEPCYVGSDVDLSGSQIGPHVSVGSGTQIIDSNLSDCVVGSDSSINGCHLTKSLIGDKTQATKVQGEINVGDYCTIHLSRK